MEAELVAAALTMKEEAVFYSNIMSERSFDKSFVRVLLHIDSTSALHLAGNRTYSSRAKHIALGHYFSCKNWWKARSASTTSSRAKFSWRTWAPSILASTVTATPSSSSTSLRLKTPKSHHLPEGGHHLPALRILAYCSHFSAHFGVIYRGARTLHCSFVVGSTHYLAHCRFSFCDQLRVMDGQTSP